jgi:HEPN domain-containing protein
MRPPTRAFLHASAEDLAAARRLLPDLPRPAAYHLQQAAEKLAKATLAAAGTVPVPRSHDIGYLAGLLPPDHALAAALAAFADLTEFHIVSRYPIGDDLVPPPDPNHLQRRADAIESLLEEALAAQDGANG